MQAVEVAADHLVGTVRDVMTQDVQTVDPSTPVAEVANQMADHNVRRIVVVDAQRKVLGVVSQRDILRHYLAGSQDEQHGAAAASAAASAAGAAPATPPVAVQSLLSRDKPVTVAPNIPLAKAAWVLATNKIGCLPVVGFGEELCGLLTTTDVLRHITGHARLTLESSFQFYAPSAGSRVKPPAYIRQKTGDLVIPRKTMTRRDALPRFALLGYDGGSGRILIKFVEERNDSEGALPIRGDDEQIVIPAAGFVTHFELSGKTTAFDVVELEDGGYVVLKPRQSA